MSYGLIFILAIIIYFNRYFFLEPKVAIRLPKFIEKMLSFSAPCLLSVICVPIIFFDGETGLREISTNAYLYAAIFGCLLMFKVKNVLWNMVGSVTFFYLLIFLIMPNI